MATGALEMSADKRKPGSQPEEPRYTTFRLHAADGEDLSELADKKNMSIANLYRELGFAEQVRKLLVIENERRLQELKARRPQ